MSENIEDLLKALIATTGRSVFPKSGIEKLISPTSQGRDKQITAYNLCDGTRKQSEIAKTLKVDQGQFSRTITRWVQQGIVFRIGKGNETKLLHVYPVEQPDKKSKEEPASN